MKRLRVTRISYCEMRLSNYDMMRHVMYGMGATITLLNNVHSMRLSGKSSALEISRRHEEGIGAGIPRPWGKTHNKEVGKKLVKVFSCTTWESCHDQALAVRAFYMNRDRLKKLGVMLSSIRELP